MKTKIIYISGNEVFEMAQIRAAFEEVRNALGLDNDTVLFGVPVDKDNVMTDSVLDVTTEVLENTVETVPVVKEIHEEVVNEIPEDIVEETPEIIDTEIPNTDVVEPELVDTNDDIVDIVEEVENIIEEEKQDTIIPILSVLSGNDTETVTCVADEVPNTEQAEQVEDTAIEEPVETIQDIDETDALQVSIEDIVTDDMPVAEHNKTLEELLESMTPLGEDIEQDIIETPESEIVQNDAENSDFSVSMTDDMADTDATLAQLANEFAQTQDKIPDTPKSTSNGKIGKLKNILPFKKAKRDDSGLMGDLFGWAGIAANDEDFSIPGFFTGVAGQK